MTGFAGLTGELLDKIDKINGIRGKGNWKPETGD
jgi:hypothetical protein